MNKLELESLLVEVGLPLYEIQDKDEYIDIVLFDLVQKERFLGYIRKINRMFNLSTRYKNQKRYDGFFHITIKKEKILNV